MRSARAARAFVRGEATEGFVVHTPEGEDVGEIRKKLGLSTVAVREWEQQQRETDFRVISHNPDAVVAASQRKA